MWYKTTNTARILYYGRAHIWTCRIPNSKEGICLYMWSVKNNSFVTVPSVPYTLPVQSLCCNTQHVRVHLISVDNRTGAISLYTPAVLIVYHSMNVTTHLYRCFQCKINDFIKHDISVINTRFKSCKANKTETLISPSRKRNHWNSYLSTLLLNTVWVN